MTFLDYCFIKSQLDKKRCIATKDFLSKQDKVKLADLNTFLSQVDFLKLHHESKLPSSFAIFTLSFFNLKELVGIAKEGSDSGIVCSSFNAG